MIYNISDEGVLGIKQSMAFGYIKLSCTPDEKYSLENMNDKRIVDAKKQGPMTG
jgi:hypothetical protein